MYGEHTTDEATTSTFRNPDTLSKLPQPDVVPTSIPGYAITDTAYLATLHKLWPAGEDAAHKRLHAFVDGELVRRYDDDRNTVALEKGTSGLSTYLASGVISAKMCVVAAMKVNGQRMDSGQKGILDVHAFCSTWLCV